MTNNNSKNKHIKRLKKVNKSFNNLRKTIQTSWRIISFIIRTVLLIFTSPLLLLLLFILILAIWFWLSWDIKDKIGKYKTPSIIINKDEVKSLWMEIISSWPNKWKLKGCENIKVPDSIYTSKIEWYIEDVYSSNIQAYNNFCFYHLLYIKNAERYYEFEDESEDIKELSNALENRDKYSKEQWNKMSVEKQKLKNRIKLAKDTIKKMEVSFPNTSRYKNYENDQIGFKSYIDYPTDYFKNNQNSLLDYMYHYNIGVTYWEAFTWWLDISYVFGESSNWVTIYNTLSELGLEYNKDNLALDYLNWQHGFNDFPEDLNNSAYYYNYNCPVCKSESWCSCTWDPEEDKNKHYWDDNMWERDFLNYVNFMQSLHENKVIYVSDNVKSPFRNYLEGKESCKVTVKLTQRDWPSNLRFAFFPWYPKVDWVRTHAWLDLASKDTCNWDEVPVYSITDWVVYYTSYSLTSWGNSIIIETIINWETYYVRYSHLDSYPDFEKGEFITTNTILWIQWDSWPSTAEHLDVTITKWDKEYKNYLRDTLWWWGLFNFTFEDMMRNWFSDYTIESYINDQCYNCD